MLAEQIGVDVGTVARWERGAHNIRPRNLAALATALGVDLNQLTAGTEPTAEAGPSERDLQRVDFIARLATASGRDFDQTYQTVATLADQLEAESSSKRHARNHSRAGVTRQDLADAVADHYDLPNNGHQPYTATVAGKELTLTIVAQPSGAGANIDLRSKPNKQPSQPSRTEPIHRTCLTAITGLMSALDAVPNSEEGQG